MHNAIVMKSAAIELQQKLSCLLPELTSDRFRRVSLETVYRFVPLVKVVAVRFLRGPMESANIVSQRWVSLVHSLSGWFFIDSVQSGTFRAKRL